MANLKLSTVETVLDRSAIADADKAAIRSDLRAAAGNLPDTWIYRIVVIALGLALFIPLVALLVKTTQDAQLLLPIATGALGALAGLLAPSPASGGG